MSKEMIISVNGREKKIAILENGQVMEFHIERGENNSGIVGNIYKGRVQRVLPGMQSAFVDIGLERDAFLYISDFFDEKEEIERIVMEKSKHKKSADEVEHEATDEIHKTRLKRDKKIDNAHEKAELGVFFVEGESDDKSKSKKPSWGRESRGPSKEDGDEKIKAKVSEMERKGNVLDVSDLEFEASEFERIVDEEDDTGEILKDAIMQESITDKVRSIEFDMESADTAEVGSLIDSISDHDNGFERVADEEEAEALKKDEVSGTARKSKRTKAAEKQVSQATKKTLAKRSSRDKALDKNYQDSEKDESLASEESHEKPSEKKSASSKEKKKSKKTQTRKNSVKAKEEQFESEKKLEDAEASLGELPDIMEMVVRRGSRGSRRKINNDLETHNDKSYKTSKTDESIVAESEIADAEFKPKENNLGGRGRRRVRPQPKITDLLREGQEILVQIAKEPIAKKGSRITSHIALPGRYLVFMPTIEQLGVSRRVGSSKERGRLRSLMQKIVSRKEIGFSGFIVRTAGIGKTEKELRDDALYLVKLWKDIRKSAEKAKSPALIHKDLDIIQRLLRDQISDEFTAIRVDSEEEYLRIIEFINRIQPQLVKRVKFHTIDQPILDTYAVSEEIDKALKHRVWLKSGGYLVINQTEALIAIDVNTGKFVGRGNARLEDTITKTNLEAVQEIARQIRLRDLGGIIVLDLIDMEDRRNRNKVLHALQEYLARDKSPTKVLSFNDFGLITMTRKRVKQSLERVLCAPCFYCEGAGWVKSAQTVCYEILNEARRLSKEVNDVRQITLRVHPEVARVLHASEREVFNEIEAYLGVVDLTGDSRIHQEQFDFAFV